MSERVKKKQNNAPVFINAGYTPPTYHKSSFHCPHCKAYAHQRWSIVADYDEVKALNMPVWEYFKKHGIASLQLSLCNHCNYCSIWLNCKMIYPDFSTAPIPLEEMPVSVKEIYNEARSIVDRSPRGACALLRLSIQQRVKELGEDETSLNDAIEKLVQKGLPQKIQQALDAVRVIGNNAVHPGKINVNDNPKIAISLFALVNFICEKKIKEEQEVETIFKGLPQRQQDSIKRRDRNGVPSNA